MGGPAMLPLTAMTIPGVPMDPTTLLLRWAHVLAAVVAMGGLVYARFAVVPALEEFDEATRDKLHGSIRRRWLPWVIGSITVLFAMGRLPGWIAHWIEMHHSPTKKICRPRQIYTGETIRDFVPIDKRS